MKGCGGGVFTKSRFTSSANEAIVSSAVRWATREGFWAVRWRFVLFPVSCAADPRLERVQFGFCIRMKKEGGGRHVLLTLLKRKTKIKPRWGRSRSAKLVWFVIKLQLKRRVNCSWEQTYFGLPWHSVPEEFSSTSVKKITKRLFFSSVRTSLWLYFPFWFLTSASFLLSILTLSRRTSPETSNLIILLQFVGWVGEGEVITESDFLLRLAAGERYGRLNYQLLRAGTVFQAQWGREGNRPQPCLLFISRWKLFLFSQFAQHISPRGLMACAPLSGAGKDEAHSVCRCSSVLAESETVR